MSQIAMKVRGEEVRSYLEGVVAVKKSHANILPIEGFVLKYGQQFRTNERSWPGGGTIKECYRNAFNLAYADKFLTYCEGFALGVIPVAHAWVVDVNGWVIDPTWESGLQYFGVPFKWPAVRASALRTKHYGMLLDDPVGQWKLVRGEIDPKSVIKQLKTRKGP